jgi:hypothetical protein
MKIKSIKPNFSKKNILAFVLVFAILGGSALVYKILSTKGATYSWLQTSWSGGATTTAKASHLTDQTGWTKYYSKDALLSTSTPGVLSLTSATTSQTDTSFSPASSTNNTYVSGGTVYLKKPVGVACSSDGECTSSICLGTCRACEGVFYGDKCFHLASIVNQSCTTVCSTFGGSTGAANDTSNCAVQRLILGSAVCDQGCTSLEPSHYPAYIGGVLGYYCVYSSNISGWSESDVNGISRRLCACRF